MSSFGWGRRACVGQGLAQDELLLACSTLLWAFNLRNKCDSRSRRLIPISAEKNNSYLIIKPDAFEMEFQPRSHVKEHVIRGEEGSVRGAA